MRGRALFRRVGVHDEIDACPLEGLQRGRLTERVERTSDIFYDASKLRETGIGGIAPDIMVAHKDTSRVLPPLVIVVAVEKHALGQRLRRDDSQEQKQRSCPGKGVLWNHCVVSFALPVPLSTVLSRACFTHDEVCRKDEVLLLRRFGVGEDVEHDLHPLQAQLIARLPDAAQRRRDHSRDVAVAKAESHRHLPALRVPAPSRLRRFPRATG